MRNKFLLPFMVLLLLAATTGAGARLRSVVNFEDNTFLRMDSAELLHRYQKIEGYNRGAYERTQLTYRLAYGILPNFEAGVNLPVVFSKSGGEQGIGDLEIYQKFKFMEKGEGLPEASGGISLVLPTARRTGTPFMGTEGLDARFFVTVGQNFTGKLSWLLNAGVRFSGDTDYKDGFSYNGALSYRAGAKAGWVLEVNGDGGGLRDESEVYASPGVLLQPRKNLSLNLSVPFGLNDNSADYKTAAQFSVDF